MTTGVCVLRGLITWACVHAVVLLRPHPDVQACFQRICQPQDWVAISGRRAGGMQRDDPVLDAMQLQQKH